jgi:hypothetical protein
MPRIMTTVFPMEIVVTQNATHLLSDYTMPRRIYTDGREFPKEIEPGFNGYSIGKWVDENGDGRYDVSKSKPAASRARAPMTRADFLSMPITRPW